MNKEAIDALRSRFPMLKHRYIDDVGMPQGDWFLLEINPVGSLDDISLIVSDINKNENVNVLPTDLILRHSNNCTATNHDLPEILDKATKIINSKSFLIAVWEGSTIYEGQPVAIPIDPEISYNMYPDHPHLNIGNTVKCSVSRSFYIPDSICYTDNVKGLGTDKQHAISEATFEISIWLLRHQIWLETRNLGKPIWIGKGHRNPEFKRNVIPCLNPKGECHCRSGKPYDLCHMASDYKYHLGYSDQQIKGINHVARWQNERLIPHTNTIKLLKKRLL